MRWFPELLGRRRTALYVALALIASSGPACGSDGDLTPPPIGSVEVDGPATMRAGESVTANAVVRDTAGAVLTGRGVSWESSAPTVATVDDEGVIQALIPGAVRISASAGDHEGFVDVTVYPSRDATAMVTVTPTHLALIAGDTTTLRATPRSSDGVGLATAEPVSWTSSDQSRARVDATGKVTAVAPGRVTISAIYDDRAGTSEMVIHPAAASLEIAAPADSIIQRDSIQLTAVMRDSSGAPITGRSITWKTLDPNATVTSSGVVLPGVVGPTRIVATSGGVADTITLRIVGPRVAGMYIGTSRLYVAVGDTGHVRHYAYDAGGSTLPGRRFTWSSADPTIATVSDGIVSGRAPGRTRITVQCDGLTSTFEVVVEDVPATISFLQDTLRLRVGQTEAPPVQLRDALGAVVHDYAVTYASGDAAIASTTAGGVRGVAAGTTVIIARSGAIADTMPLVIVGDTATISFSFNSAGSGVYLGERTEEGLHVSGSYGYAMGRTVRFRSSDPGILAVAPSSAVVNGVIWVQLEGVGIGRAEVIAEVDGWIGRQEVSVNHVPLASLEIVAGPTILRPTRSAAFTTRMVDIRGTVRAYPVTWRSLNPGVATVDANGVVTAVAVGTAEIIAQRDLLADTARVDVQPDAAPTISEISPAALGPGGTAVIRGQNFDPVAGNNQVTVAGVTVSVTAASATELTISLPASGYPCAATKPVRVIVTANGLVGDTLHPLRSARQQPALAVGESVMLTGADARCVEIAPGGQIYLMTLSFGATHADATATIRVRGESSVPVAAAPPPAPVAAAPAAPPAPFDVASPDHAALAERADNHRRARAMLPALLKRFGRPPASVAASSPAATTPSLSLRSPVLGEVLTFRVPLFEAANYCADYSTVRARVVYVGPKAVVLEDVDAPLARTMDSWYQQIGAEFGSQMMQIVERNIGNPLVRDGQLGGNGRVVLLFSRAVNDYGLFGVFYSPCDMYPRSTLPASNETPVLYGAVPDHPDIGYQVLGTKDNWRRLIRTPLMHQAAHLAIDGERIALGLGPLDVWLDEALANAAQEIYLRPLSGTFWRSRATYAQTLYCEVRPTAPACAGRPLGMYDVFAPLYFHAEDNERRTPLGPTSADDGTFYGSGWWLLRWALDHHAVSEDAFLKSLARTPLSGADALVSQTGVPMSEMLADLGMTLLIPYVVPFQVSRSKLTVPSWNWHDIFRGMEGDFSAFQGYPAQPRAFAYGSFDSGPITLKGGSTAYLELFENQTKNQAIIVTGVGQPAPTSISLEIIRAR